ncbi:IclR family transcriptional regulator domain-containing protein [Nocardioides pakistanensis]
MTVEEAPRSDHHVRSLARGLSVIRAFGPDRPEQTLSEVARRTGLSRSGARRFLLTLVDLGYVRSDGKVFTLTPKVLDLGYSYLSSLTLPAIAEPHLEQLVREVRESSSMAVLDGGEVVYVARVPTSRIMSVDIKVGTRFAAYATSMGRALLAHVEPAALGGYLAGLQIRRFTDRTVRSADELAERLEEVRRLGYAMVAEELEEGLISLAVPVRGRDGRVLAAVNVSSLVTRVPAEKVEDLLLPALRRCVDGIEADLRSG